MTRKQRLELKLSELRTKLGGILDIPDDQRGETWSADLASAKTELRSTETEFQAAVLVEPETTVVTVDAEARELDRLIERASVGEFVGAVLAQRGTTGEIAELQAHHKLNANFLPLDVLRHGGESEHRAVTPGAGEVGQNQAEIVAVRVPAGRCRFPGDPAADHCSGRGSLPRPYIHPRREDTGRERRG